MILKKAQSAKRKTKIKFINMEKKLTTDGRCWVKLGNKIIAQSYVGNGYEVRILQGMPRMETLERINRECPEFLNANAWSVNKVPKLFK